MKKMRLSTKLVVLFLSVRILPAATIGTMALIKTLARAHQTILSGRLSYPWYSCCSLPGRTFTTRKPSGSFG